MKRAITLNEPLRFIVLLVGFIICLLFSRTLAAGFFIGATLGSAKVSFRGDRL